MLQRRLSLGFLRLSEVDRFRDEIEAQRGHIMREMVRKTVKNRLKLVCIVHLFATGWRSAREISTVLSTG
jgi:hypothetical protein